MTSNESLQFFKVRNVECIIFSLGEYSLKKLTRLSHFVPFDTKGFPCLTFFHGVTFWNLFFYALSGCVKYLSVAIPGKIRYAHTVYTRHLTVVNLSEFYKKWVYSYVMSFEWIKIKSFYPFNKTNRTLLLSNWRHTQNAYQQMVLIKNYICVRMKSDFRLP